MNLILKKYKENYKKKFVGNLQSFYFVQSFEKLCTYTCNMWNKKKNKEKNWKINWILIFSFQIDSATSISYRKNLNLHNTELCISYMSSQSILHCSQNFAENLRECICFGKLQGKWSWPVFLLKDKEIEIDDWDAIHWPQSYHDVE